MEEGRRPLRVTIRQGGGFVPVVTTTIADTAALAPADAKRLRAKVAHAALAPGDAQRGQPTYLFIVEDVETTRVSLSEGDLTDAHRDLIDFVGSVPGHEEKIGSPGK